MVLEEALKLADEANKEGYLNRYPQACIRLAWEVRKLQRKLSIRTAMEERLDALCEKQAGANRNPCAEIQLRPYESCVLPHEIPEDGVSNLTKEKNNA